MFSDAALRVPLFRRRVTQPRPVQCTLKWLGWFAQTFGCLFSPYSGAADFFGRTGCGHSGPEHGEPGQLPAPRSTRGPRLVPSPCRWRLVKGGQPACTSVNKSPLCASSPARRECLSAPSSGRRFL